MSKRAKNRKKCYRIAKKYIQRYQEKHGEPPHHYQVLNFIDVKWPDRQREKIKEYLKELRKAGKLKGRLKLRLGDIDEE